MRIERITPEQANKLLGSRDYVYVDVRTPVEFEAGHIPGAKNVPILVSDTFGRMFPNPLFAAVVEANFGKECRIIVGCQMGGRSLRAAEALLACGFRHVLEMRGGCAYIGTHPVPDEVPALIRRVKDYEILAVRAAGRRREAELRLHGRRVQARFQAVERNTSLEVNGNHPWRIVCQWQDPTTGLLHLFKSRNLWFDPTPYVKVQELTVFVDPRKPKRHFVDVSFLPRLAE